MQYNFTGKTIRDLLADLLDEKLNDIDARGSFHHKVQIMKYLVTFFSIDQSDCKSKHMICRNSFIGRDLDRASGAERSNARWNKRQQYTCNSYLQRQAMRSDGVDKNIWLDWSCKARYKRWRFVCNECDAVNSLKWPKTHNTIKKKFFLENPFRHFPKM